MKHWKQILLGILIGLLLGGLWRLTKLPKPGEPFVLVTLTPNLTPEATATAEMIQVHIAGAVNSPGVYSLPEGSNVNQAIELAGGPTEQAATNMINLATLLEDGQRVYIPSIDDSNQDTQRGTTISLPGLVNINTATQAELESLPGIGAVKASAIIGFRTSNGFFLSIEDLLKVDGIGASTFDQLKDLITVSP